MTPDPLDAVRDPERLAALHNLALLDTPAEETYDRLTRLASRLLSTPVALVSFVDEERQFFKSSVGLGEPWASRREMPLEYSYCQHAVASKQTVAIPDARQDARVQSSPAVSENNSLAYIGVPLFSGDGHPLGTFCVVDTRPRPWTGDQVSVLEELAALVMIEIKRRRAVRQVTREAEESERQRAQEEEQRRLREAAETILQQRAFLREVLFSVTEGRLRLCDTEADLPAALPFLTDPLALSKSVLRTFRGQVQQAAEARNFSRTRCQDLLMAANEAAMNTVVHAQNGSGRVCGDAARTVQVWVEDGGGGIAWEGLHRATLERGFSSAGTLGHGFWFVLQTCDRVWLLTGARGTTVVLEQDREAGEGGGWLTPAAAL